MKSRIRVRVDAEITRQLKQKAGEQRCSLSELIQEVLLQYLSKDTARRHERKRAYQLFCEHPMKIPASQLRYILGENMWG